jgi:flagellar biosynthesis component FlhA
LELSSKAAREHLERLPEKMMAIEAQLSHGKLDQGEADQAKARIHRQADRLAANDGLGRFLYALLKLHLLRLSLQTAGTITINAWPDGLSLWRMLTIASSLLIADGLFIVLPYLLLLSVIPLLGRQS